MRESWCCHDSQQPKDAEDCLLLLHCNQDFDQECRLTKPGCTCPSSGRSRCISSWRRRKWLDNLRVVGRSWSSCRDSKKTGARRPATLWKWSVQRGRKKDKLRQACIRSEYVLLNESSGEANWNNLRLCSCSVHKTIGRLRYKRSNIWRNYRGLRWHRSNRPWENSQATWVHNCKLESIHWARHVQQWSKQTENIRTRRGLYWRDALLDEDITYLTSPVC